MFFFLSFYLGLQAVIQITPWKLVGRGIESVYRSLAGGYGLKYFQLDVNDPVSVFPVLRVVWLIIWCDGLAGRHSDTLALCAERRG